MAEETVSTPIASDNNNNNTTPETPERTNSAFHSYGVFVDQNSRHRRRMEDAHYIEDKFLGSEKVAFVGVYDGHGGKEAADFAANNFHKILEENINKHNLLQNPDFDEKIMQDIFIDVYAETDEKMKNSNVPSHHGSTSVTVLIFGEGKKKRLFSANAGDARAVLCRNGQALTLTCDHKASDEDEKNRILNAGGFVINGRVNGQIIITRSLGDHLMKDFIINTPFQKNTDLTEEDNFLIVACDGLWDVIEDQTACDFLTKNSQLSCQELAKQLGIQALKNGTTDNLSIIVIRL